MPPRRRYDPAVLLSAIFRNLPALASGGTDALKLTGPFSKVTCCCSAAGCATCRAPAAHSLLAPPARKPYSYHCSRAHGLPQPTRRCWTAWCPTPSSATGSTCCPSCCQACRQTAPSRPRWHSCSTSERTHTHTHPSPRVAARASAFVPVCTCAHHHRRRCGHPLMPAFCDCCPPPPQVVPAGLHAGLAGGRQRGHGRCAGQVRASQITSGPCMQCAVVRFHVHGCTTPTPMHAAAAAVHG